MVGFCHLTDSHHYHHGQKPTMVGICHGGNMLGNPFFAPYLIVKIFWGIFLFRSSYHLHAHGVGLWDTGLRLSRRAVGGSLQALLLAQATRTASTSALLTFPRTSPKLHMLNKTPRFKPTRLIYAIMLGVKVSPLKLKVFRLIDFLSMATICLRYIQAMPKISPRYAQDSSKYA